MSKVKNNISGQPKKDQVTFKNENSRWAPGFPTPTSAKEGYAAISIRQSRKEIMNQGLYIQPCYRLSTKASDSIEPAST